MNKTVIETATVKLALSALKELVAQTESGLFAVKHDHVAMQDARQAITAMREALAEQPAHQEPVAWAMYQKGRLLSFWIEKGDAYDFEFTSEHSWAPLYTTPQAPKENT